MNTTRRYGLSVRIDGGTVADVEYDRLAPAIRRYRQECLMRDSSAHAKPRKKGTIALVDSNDGYRVVGSSVWKSGYGWAVDVCLP